MKLYGSVSNRLSEGRNNVGKRYVGEDITMYYWSDRDCYFITDVISDKEIRVKKYYVVAGENGGIGCQDWLYFKTQNEMNEYLNEHRGCDYNTDLPEPQSELWVYRYNSWWKKNEGKYTKINQKLSFGVRDYYYDWEF
jgi:hypothetical protein